jgi:peptidoglycan/LPS O-acetylase OafA/YrhL
MLKKDNILMVLRVIIGLGMIGYAYYLWSNKLVITTNPEYNLYWIIFLAAFGVFALIMGIFPICFPRMRLIQFVAGIALILIWYYFFKDNPSQYVFVSDILRVLGVLLVILGPIGLCVPDKCIKQEEEKKVEIIEV